MQLQFSHASLRFFFITVALEGRPRTLSRLVDETSRPALLPAGEVVKAALLAYHKVYPCVTVSDYVIMPDHLHFLLIVNYGLMPAFNPLWATHRLLDAIETAWNTRGQAPEPPYMVALFNAAVAEGRRRVAAGLPAGGTGAAAPVPSLRFDRHAYIEMSFTPPQLKAIRRYIRLNPARALWKARNADRFIRFANIGHAVLDPSRTWSAMGNLTLLGSPFLVRARLTLKKTVAEHEASIADLVAQARRGAVIVSGFISPGETELLKRLKATPDARFIKMLPCTLPPRYDPSAEDSRELAADRLLILSGFTNTTPHISAREMRQDPAAAHLFRANCLEMNDLAATLCAKAQALG